MSRNWNEYNLNYLTINKLRASLVPAAAVIPAPVAYINVVAVKKLVVGFWKQEAWSAVRSVLSFLFLRWHALRCVIVPS